MTPLLLALAVALGGPEPTEAAEPGEEIVVYGELRVKEAREKVVADLEALGFTRIKDKDGKLVMRHAQNWKGKVVFHDDGRLQFKRQPPEASMPDTFFKRASPLIGWVPCVVVPTACVKAGGWVVSERKLGAVHRNARAAVESSHQELSERQADLAIDRKLDDLDARLVACWEQGVPLDGDETQRLATPVERRQHLLRYWQTRTDTVWGDRMRTPVEGFLRQVVQDSDHPVTAEELDRVNANRDGRSRLKLPVAPPATK